MESPPKGITVELANEDNLYDWKVYMDGPEGSPYQVSGSLESEIGTSTFSGHLLSRVVVPQVTRYIIAKHPWYTRAENS